MFLQLVTCFFTLKEISVHIALPWVMIGSLSSLPSQQSSSMQRQPASKICKKKQLKLIKTFHVKFVQIMISSIHITSEIGDTLKQAEILNFFKKG